MTELPGLIRDLALISIYAAIVTLVFKKIKQPVVLGYILAGILIGPYCQISPTVVDFENIKVWADIGVIFLLFGLGLEFSFKKIVNVGKSAMIAANANILFMLFLGYQVGLFLGWSTTDSLFLGGMISMSSTTIIIKAFEELNLRRQPFRDIVFGILVVEDLVGILILVLLPTVAVGKTVNGLDVIYSVLQMGFFLVLWFITGIYIIPTFLKKIQEFLNDEMLLITAIALCLGMVLLAVQFGFSSALGAFVMGSILAETEVVEQIEKIFKPVKDFFGAIFFVSVGLAVNPYNFIEYTLPIIVISLVVVLGRISMNSLGVLISGKPLETALKCGFSLAQVGEFAFIIAAVGTQLGVISKELYPIIVAVSVITTFTTPLMIKMSKPAYNYINKRLPEKVQLFLAKHTSNVPPTHAEENLWKELFYNYFMKLSITSVIVIAIININFFVVYPYLIDIFPENVSSIITTIITLAMMSPFLRNLLTPRDRVKKIYTTLWTRSVKKRLPLVLMIAFRMIIAAMYIMIVINHFLTKNIYVTYIIVFILLLLMYRSQGLMNQYHRIEGQFLSNLYSRKEKEEPEEEEKK